MKRQKIRGLLNSPLIEYLTRPEIS
jgi:hypothetical protein